MLNRNNIFSQIEDTKKWQIDHLFDLAKADLLTQVGWNPNESKFFVNSGCFSLGLANAICDRFHLEGLVNTKVVYKWFPYPQYGLEIIVSDTSNNIPSNKSLSEPTSNIKSSLNFF